MKNKLIAASLLCSAVCQAGIAHAGGFSSVFSDDFNGSSLSARKWATRYVYADGTLGHLNDEQQSYGENENHVLSSGALSLVAKSLGNGDYSSGMIRSRQTFYYGYFEARVFLPNARGVWPAFWLNSDYDADGRLKWPPEIDAFEYVINGDTETPDMLHSGVAVRDEPARGGTWLYRDPAFNQQWTFFRAGAALNTDWQVIGLLWKPDSVTMYLNGRKLYTRTYRWLYDGKDPAGPAHVILNLAVGGSWAGLHGVDDARFPQALKVDYVRVCQYTPTGTDQLCAGSLYSPTASEAAYSTPAGDMARTRLVSAQLSKTTLVPGDTVSVSYTFDARPTPTDHQLRTTLVNASGSTVALVAASPPIPTSRWSGPQSVTQALVLPKTLLPGAYRLLVSIASKDPLLAGIDRRISMNAASSFGVADGKLRYTVGSVAVVGP
jgi:beta-glucanase (GH16 family)